LSAGKHFRQHIGVMVGLKSTSIPTTSGLPLQFLRQISAVGSVEGELKVRFESEQLESPRGLTAELKLRTSGIATHLHKAFVWSPVVVSGRCNTALSIRGGLTQNNKIHISDTSLIKNLIERDKRTVVVDFLRFAISTKVACRNQKAHFPATKVIENFA
jgi:hypothetical protein